ncbi:MAG: Zn-ribbon domain-containing OB-fold protein [Chloroflexi bacterium]|nr:MAG: Zn-ribbon domain-containing OB-fold protein [Chloroflexota bacterium]
MPDRPMPAFPELDTQAYWDATKEKKLIYQQCSACSTVVFTPRAHCTGCGSGDLKTLQSKGEGTVYTFSVVRQNRQPAFAEMGAYSIAYIDLDEGFRMLSTVVGVKDPTTDIEVGMRVKVDFERQDSSEYLVPVFRPA